MLWGGEQNWAYRAYKGHGVTGQSVHKEHDDVKTQDRCIELAKSTRTDRKTCNTPWCVQGMVLHNEHLEADPCGQETNKIIQTGHVQLMVARK